ncbi:MAG: hypothetical protein LUF33_00165, partial [Clostridiales bacterium]|nr:hypothetical protein [Clostridiales bacterium]
QLDAGVSGIGLMTTFELLKKYNGSFELDEALHSDVYRKKVSICFDNLRQYRIRTDRQEVAAALKKREDVIFL